MSDDQKENKKMEPRRIATVKQIDFLLDFLRDNVELRQGRMRSKEAVVIIRNLWDACTEELNKLGPTRNAKEWAKYWSDLKSRVKSKISDITEKSLESGEPAKLSALTYIEKKIVKILQLELNKPSPDMYLEWIDSSSSLNFNVVKEEKEEKHNPMNVEDFICTVPIVDVTTSPSADDTRSSVISIDIPLPTSTLTQGLKHSPLCGPMGPSRGLPSLVQKPQFNRATSSMVSTPPVQRPTPVPVQTVPPSPKRHEDTPQRSSTPKRRRRRVVVPVRPGSQCSNCTDFKEFGQMILKLEESHAQTMRLQTEAALKMTEVLKLQAEGMINTGAALRDMANNLSRLLEAQVVPNRSIKM